MSFQRHGRTLGIVAVCAAAVGCTGESAPQQKAGSTSVLTGLDGPIGNLDSTAPLGSSPELVAKGKLIFGKQCSACHGPEGKGDGSAAYLLYPRPRSFVAAKYRIVSTWEGMPTDEDLFHTISRGMPGSAMPSWAHLPEKARWALVHYVKSLAAEPLAVGAPTPDDPNRGVIPVPPEPPLTREALARGAALFQEACAACHGAAGKGDGAQKQIDDLGMPTRPRDLTLGIYKGSPRPEHVYRRIVAGLPGTPMPSSPHYAGPDGWALTRFVRSLSSDTTRERVEMRRFEIVAPRVKALPSHPDDGGWRQARSVNLHLMPLWWRPVRPEEVTVEALHDGKEIALRLRWVDDTHDQTALRPQDFRDAAAVQLSADPEPPFFAMGEAAQSVNIWMWKSERQADLEPAYQDLERVYPNIGIDAYPNLSRSALEQPLRNALTLESDPTFVTAWGAGNIVADPTRRSPVEDLVAHGFGTLRARPRVDQTVKGVGVYETGTYHVLLRRTLQGQGPGAVDLQPGRSVEVGFAVWNGSAGDRDGKKSVTIWQSLKLE